MTRHLSPMSSVGAALISIAVAFSGCSTRNPVYDGRCVTSPSHNEEGCFGKLFQRGFPADYDEQQYSVFGTNEWLQVELYPDGSPCRVRHGRVSQDVTRDVPSYETEYDFFGNVLSRHRCSSYLVVADVDGGITGSEISPSAYWNGNADGSRIVLCLSSLYSGHSVGMYCYQESDTNLMVGVWALDRKNKKMDKLVFGLEMDNGKIVTLPGKNVAVPQVKNHLGSLTDIRKVSVDKDDYILVQLQVMVDGKVELFDGFINPVKLRGLTNRGPF